MNNFNKLRPFPWFCINNFPFIEQTFDEINIWNLLGRVVGKLNEVIENANKMGVQVKDLTNLVNQLQEYIEHYFDNLDVQEEINNKLDQMVESGELESIINNILTLSIYTFNTMNEAIDYDLQTNARFKVTDRNSLYIVGNDDETTTDGIFKIELNNGNFAYLQYDSSVNFEITGQVCEEDRNYSKVDMKQYLEIILNRIINNNANITEIVFNSGTWLFSPTCINLGINNKSLNIKGKTPVRVFNGYSGKSFTNFAPYNDEQTYIIKLGGNPSFQSNPIGSRGLSISDIRFTSIQDNNDDITPLITKGALYIDNNSGGIFPRLDFYKINGVCLAIRASFELDFGVVNIRTKANYDYDAIIFDDIIGSNATYNNISSCNFETLRMENCAGNYVYIHPKSNFDMNTINYFELENNYPDLLGAERKQDYDGTQTIENKKYIFHGNFRRLQISHMNLSMHSNYYGRYNNENYRVDSIFCYDTPTNENQKFNRFQVGQMYIHYTNSENANKIKQFICDKKYTCGNECIQINQIYISDELPITQGLFSNAENVNYNRIQIGQIIDNHDTTSTMAQVIKAYTVPNVLNTGTIKSFENSRFKEGLGLSKSGSKVADFKASINGEHKIGLGVYCPSGAYRIVVGTTNGNVVLSDDTVETARYVDISGDINCNAGDTITITLSNNTPDIIVDYITEY